MKFLLTFCLVSTSSILISQIGPNTTIVEIGEFTTLKFKEIKSSYKYSENTIKNLFGLAQINNLEVIQPKYELKLQINIDSIECFGVFQNGEHFAMPYFESNYDGSIYIEYLYLDELLFLNYRKKIDSTIMETLSINPKSQEFISYRNEQPKFQIVNNLNQLKIEGHYKLVEQTKSDTVDTYNSFTYETYRRITEVNQHLVETGEIKTYNKEGKLIDSRIAKE